jgi:peroxiredoxin Q/BCP
LAKKAAGKKIAIKKTAEKVAAKPAAKAAGKVAGKAAVKAEYKIGLGDQAPDFSLPSTSGQTLSKKNVAAKLFVLYFYPKDNTPGCTLEGQDFSKLYKSFRSAGCEVIGVSRDSLKSHESFKEKCALPFALIADEKGLLCKAFDVIQMKSLYGRKFEGIERSTFVIDKLGKIRGEWRRVKVDGHAQRVLEYVKTLG